MLGAETNCENGSIYTVNSDEYDEFLRYKKGQWLGAINAQQGNTTQHEKSNSIARLNGGPKVEIELNGKNVKFLIDTGSPINVIDESTFNLISTKIKLEKCNTNFYGYTSNIPLLILGQFIAEIKFKDK